MKKLRQISRFVMIGIFTVFFSLLHGYAMQIGGADGPTAIYVTENLHPLVWVIAGSVLLILAVGIAIFLWKRKKR